MTKQDEAARMDTMGDSGTSRTASANTLASATVSDVPSPLPWGVTFEDERWLAMSGRYYVAKLIESPGDWDENGDQRHTPEANARLIVRCVNAFPHLVSALRDLVDAHRLPRVCVHDAEPDFCDGCRYAIEKAVSRAVDHARAALRLASEGSET